MFEWILLFLLLLILIVIAITWQSFYTPDPSTFGQYNSLGVCIPNPETEGGCLQGREQTFQPIPIPKPQNGQASMVASQFGSWIPCPFPNTILPDTSYIESNVPWTLFQERLSEGTMSCQSAPGVISQNCGPIGPTLSLTEATEAIVGPQKSILDPQINYPIDTCLGIGRVYLDLYPYGTVADQVKNRIGLIVQDGKYWSSASPVPNPPTDASQTVQLGWSSSIRQALLVGFVPSDGGYKIAGCFGGGIFGWVTDSGWVPWRWSTSLPGLVSCLTQAEAPIYPLEFQPNSTKIIPPPIIALGQKEILQFQLTGFPGIPTPVVCIFSLPWNHFDTQYNGTTLRRLLRERSRNSLG